MKHGRVAVLLLILCAAATCTWAQVDTGAILGTVKDQAGAVVPGVKVTLTSEGTGITTSTVSRFDGSYIFTPVRIGMYTVAAELPGFETTRHIHVEVNVQQQVVVDFSLRPGQVTETVEVTGTAALVQTQNASLGQVGKRPAVDLRVSASAACSSWSGMSSSVLRNRGELWGRSGS
jgi:hypothetical protein